MKGEGARELGNEREERGRLLLRQCMCRSCLISPVVEMLAGTLCVCVCVRLVGPISEISEIVVFETQVLEQSIKRGLVHICSFFISTLYRAEMFP